MMKFTRIVVLLLAVNFGFTACGSEAKKKPTQQVAIKNPKKLSFHISGMTCEIGCAKIIQSKLSKKAGINRFNWDMRHRGSWSKNKKFSFINGPMVKPGKYKVNFNVDGNSYSQDFEILPDPRLSDISRDDYNEQEELLLKIRDFMTEVRMFDRMVESKLEKKKKNKILNLVSEELNTQEGTYMRPMLIDQIRYLQAMLSRADQRPGNDAYLRLNELRSQFKLLKEKLG